MKGKTGKTSALRGGGIARKGVGMALKGGGVARKGTGSNSTPGGKVAKMAMGGTPPMTPPPRMTTPGMGAPRMGTPGMGAPVGITPVSSGKLPMTRPGFGSSPVRGMPPRAGEEVNRPRMPGRANLKDGGNVAKYAKGGSVKMTAGAGSGSGRLEKVAAHKAAKRVPAAGLKSGGIASSPLAVSSSREDKASKKYDDAFSAAGRPTRPLEEPKLKKMYKTYTDAASARAKIGAKYVKKAKGK